MGPPKGFLLFSQNRHFPKEKRMKPFFGRPRQNTDLVLRRLFQYLPASGFSDLADILLFYKDGGFHHPG